MRARFRIGALLGTAALAGSMALALAPAAANASTALTLVNVTVPGPLGGSQTCISPTPGCINLPAIDNLTVTASATVNGLSLPVIVPTTVPGCTGLINVGATLTALGASGSVTLTLSYELADASGNPIPGSQTTITKTIPFGLGAPPVTITECALSL